MKKKLAKSTIVQDVFILLNQTASIVLGELTELQSGFQRPQENILSFKNADGEF